MGALQPLATRWEGRLGGSALLQPLPIRADGVLGPKAEPKAQTLCETKSKLCGRGSGHVQAEGVLRGFLYRLRGQAQWSEGCD